MDPTIFSYCRRPTLYTNNKYVINFCREYGMSVIIKDNTDEIVNSSKELETSVNNTIYTKIGKVILNYFNDVTFEPDGIYIHCSNKDKAIKLYKEVSNAIDER